MKRVICIILFIVTIATLTSCTANPTPITVECTCCCHTEESSGEGTKDFEKPYEGYIDSIEFISIDRVGLEVGYYYQNMQSDSIQQLSIEYVSENMVKLVRTRTDDDNYEVFYIPVSSIKYISIDGKNLEK